MLLIKFLKILMNWQSGMKVNAKRWPCDRLMIGTAGFGNWVCEHTAHEIVNAALALGIHRFDTAASYGRSEEILGHALSAHSVPVKIATKISPEIDLTLERPVRGQILRFVERSLLRLKRDRIDLLQLHDPIPDSLVDDTFGTFETLLQQGVVAAIGLCNYTTEALKALIVALPGYERARPVMIQNQHNLLNPGTSAALLSVCDDQGLALWAWSPLAGGLLTGRYGAAKPLPANSRAGRGHWMPVENLENHLPNLELLKARYGTDLTHFALNWVLSSTGVSGAIIGPSKVEHLNIINKLSAL